MSVVAKRIGIDSPRAFNIFNIFYLGDVRFDASPIYSTFRMTVEINGTYSDATYDYVYAYTGTKTWDREEVRSNGITDNLPSIDINGVSETPTGSYGAARTPTDDYFIMALFPAMDMNPSAYPMFVPKFPAASFVLGNGGVIENGAIIGTRTHQITLVSEDIIANVTSGVPTFSVYSSTPTDPRFFVDGFECTAAADALFSATISEDTTAWTAAKWRDFRGTYTGTDTDANGITTDIELVLG